MKRYGLIGYPLTHSFSKKYFEDKFAAEGLANVAFELFPLENIDDFPGLLSSHQDLSGLAVTIPYKESVIKFLDDADAAAQEIRAVNCIQFFGNKLIGYNTDAKGFELSLLPMLKPFQRKALVLGTGGASKAVKYVLQRLGIDVLTVSRTANAQGEITYQAVNEQIISERLLIVNCTPKGQFPAQHELPGIPYQFLTPEHFLYDLIYNPDETAFLQQGKMYGCSVKNGLEMLELQAAENWKIWNR